MIIGKSDDPVKSGRLARVDWLIAVIVAVVAFAIYLRTLAPDMLPGDAGEFQFAAWRLGLSHPTGYPLYMLLGSIWQHGLVLAGVSPAAALNALSALFAALAVAVMYLLLLDAPVDSPVSRRLVALFAAAMLAVNFTFWTHAVIAEVYTLHALLLLLLLWVLQRAAQPGSTAASSHEIAARHLFWVALLLGLSLAHHAMTLLAIPAVLLYLWMVDADWWRMSLRNWLATVGALVLPLALYAYIPLRSGPRASPWYHQSIGNSTLSLYQGGWDAFVSFLTGRSISVGFYSPAQALANVPHGVELWRTHFGILGIALVALGIYAMFDSRREFLWLTAGIAVAQQIFNLFYAIGDIGAYYIPLYAIATIWSGYGAAYLADGSWLRMGDTGQAAGRATGSWGNAGALIALALFLMPVNALMENGRQADQSANHSARTQWQPIVAALPAGDAILVSNDRDEIPPFFYLQAVEKAAPNAAALHPLMAPDERFADLGATIDTALRKAGGAPVYLIKPMPGLEIKYALEQADASLVSVAERPAETPAITTGQPHGGLTLAGFDWQPSGDQVLVRLHWRVDTPLSADYTTSVQLFDEAGNRIAQSDRPPGGVFYPTSLWKPGERLIEDHTLVFDTPPPAGDFVLQVGMYESEGLEKLAEPLRFVFSPANLPAAN